MAAKSVSRRRKKRYTTEAPGTERAWLRRVIFLTGFFFILAGSNVVSGRPCTAWFRRTNDEYDGGQAASRILTAGRRGRACGFAGAVGLNAGRRRAASPACSLRRRHGAENGGRTGVEAVQGARGATAAERLFRPHLRAIRDDPTRSGDRDLERSETWLFPRAAASWFRLHDADRNQHCRERHGGEGDLRRR